MSNSPPKTSIKIEDKIHRDPIDGIPDSALATINNTLRTLAQDTKLHAAVVFGGQTEEDRLAKLELLEEQTRLDIMKLKAKLQEAKQELAEKKYAIRNPETVAQLTRQHIGKIVGELNNFLSILTQLVKTGEFYCSTDNQSDKRVYPNGIPFFRIPDDSHLAAVEYEQAIFQALSTDENPIAYEIHGVIVLCKSSSIQDRKILDLREYRVLTGKKHEHRCPYICHNQIKGRDELVNDLIAARLLKPTALPS